MKTTKATISVEETSFGYSVVVTLSREAMLFPSVTISYHSETKEVGYIVELDADNVVTADDYEVAREKAGQTPAGDFLEVAELIHRQKQVRMQGESWRNVVDDILTL